MQQAISAWVRDWAAKFSKNSSGAIITIAGKLERMYNLGAVGLMGALFCFQRHSGKADGQTVIGDGLHQPVIHHHKAKLLADHIYDQQNRAAQKGRRNQTFAKKRHSSP